MAGQRRLLAALGPVAGLLEYLHPSGPSTSRLLMP